VERFKEVDPETDLVRGRTRCLRAASMLETLSLTYPQSFMLLQGLSDLIQDPNSTARNGRNKYDAARL
jgi:hypothetical protein